MLSIELAPRAFRDLQALPPKFSQAVLDDLELLRTLPWPKPPKVKQLSGTPYIRLRTGDFRSIAYREGEKVVVIRVADRKDLEKILRNLL